MEPTEPAPTENGKADKRFDLCQFLDFANTPGTHGLFFNPDDKVTFFQCHTNAKLTGDLHISKLSVCRSTDFSTDFALFCKVSAAKVGQSRFNL